MICVRRRPKSSFGPTFRLRLQTCSCKAATSRVPEKQNNLAEVLPKCTHCFEVYVRVLVLDFHVERFGLPRQTASVAAKVLTIHATTLRWNACSAMRAPHKLRKTLLECDMKLVVSAKSTFAAEVCVPVQNSYTRAKAVELLRRDTYTFDLRMQI